ncbi:MAG: hypothetical protein FJW83_09490 [Actinobacteria bacterium]|nr:hypothetical protein [Actinomycetota bacterium]
MSSDRTAEDAVRRYLQYLADPDSAVDQAVVARLEADVAAATDVIDRLVALSQLRAARNVDESTLRDAFVRHARTFATERGVDAAAFLTMGVQPQTLREAGFDVGGVPTTPTRTRRPVPTRTRARRPSVQASRIAEGLAGRTTEFTLGAVMAEFGGTPVTVRKAVEGLVEAGRAERLGPDPAHRGPGRAPVRFRMVA